MKEISELPWFEVNKLITQFQRKFNMKVEKKLQIGIQLANSKVEVFRLFLVVVELLQFIRRLKEHSFFPFECSQHIFHKMTLQRQLCTPTAQVSSVASRVKNVFSYRPRQTILVFIYRMSNSIIHIQKSWYVYSIGRVVGFVFERIYYCRLYFSVKCQFHHHVVALILSLLAWQYIL